MEGLTRDSVDELHLAALLGKTLLEQNRDLELKLKTLQDFAEETLIVNKTLSRRFSQSQGSLHLSNKSCEQLEMKIEELEKANCALLKLCDGRQHTIEHRNSKIHELEDKIDHLEQEILSLNNHSSNESTKTNKVSSTSTVEEDGNSLFSQQLQTVIDELTLKAQKMSVQKQALEQEVKRLYSETQTLRTALEQTELAITEIQEQCTTFEEDTLSSDIITSPRAKEVQTTSAHHSTFSPTTTYEDQLFSPQVTKSFKLPKTSEKQGESLFNEIDQQCSTLLQQYEDLLHSCTCSASLAHMKKNATVRALTNACSTTKDVAAADGPFKDLFDDMFAALRQTAQVADRLIVRKRES